MKYLYLLIITIFLFFTIASNMLCDTNEFTAFPGKLKVEGSKLIDQSRNQIQLKGMSSHGLQWFGNFANYNAIKELKDKWGQTVFRAAMYTNEGGYLSNHALKDKVHEIVRACIDLGVYVIIDWHILSDNNPMEHVTEAKEFFNEMSKTYSRVPNIFYELCNEPNGNWVTWDGYIKPYAEQLISVIRANDPDSIIIVGTPTWSQDVNIATSRPLNYNNIMYTVHFYAGTHGQWLRDRVTDVTNRGFAIFVTEWGTMDSSGNGGINYGETEQWMNLLRDKKISWANWSLSNSGQTHSVIQNWGNPNGPWSDNDLTESGKLVKKYMKQ